jgi:nucleoside-diphosphate-sugar epimerase
MTLLVTGASGFLGSNVLEQLLACGSSDIHAVARRMGPVRSGIHWHEQDLLAPGAARAIVAAVQPRTIIHLAWCAEPGRFWTSPDNERWLEMTRELASAAIDHRVERLVAAGSCAEYDWTGDGILIENRTPLRPATLYGQAKHAAHMHLAERATASGLSVAWLRVFWTCGRHEPPGRLVPEIILGLRAGRAVPLTVGTQRIDLVAAADVARAFVAAASSTTSGSFDIASGTGVSVRQIAEALAVMVNGFGSLDLGARPTPALTQPALVIGRAEALRQTTGWSPGLPFDAMLREAVSWWSSQPSPC